MGSTTITIRNSGTVIPIIEAKGGGVENSSCWSSGAGIGSGGNTLNKTTINIEGGIITAEGGVSSASDPSYHGSQLSGAGIGSGSNVSGETVINISGGTITKAKGGKYGGAGIGSGSSDTKNDSKKGVVTINITNGTITEATGGNHGAGIGSGYIGNSSKVNISGSAKLQNVRGGEYAAGIGSGHGSNKVDVVIDGGTINATGGFNAAGIGSGDNGPSSVTIKSGTVNAAGNEYSTSGSSGIGGSYTDVTISGGTITATGYKTGAGIGSSYSGHPSNITITGGTITANGTSDAPAIGNGIVSIGNSDTALDLTATAPDADNAIRGRNGKKLDEIIHLKENGKLGLVKLVENGVTRLFHNRVYTESIYPAVSETHPLGEWVITKKPTCTEKGEKQRSCKVSDCVVTETEELPALGHQWSGWTPVEGGSREYRSCAGCGAVEYRDVSHNSGISDSSTISTGLRVLDPAQADILQNAQLVRLSQISDVLYIDVSHETASLQGVLSDLTGLRSENIETIVFSTERCTSTLSLSDVAALGAGDTPFTLSHSGSTATFTVGGADHSALLR